MVFALTHPVRLPDAERRIDGGRALLFETFQPAMRLAVEAGVPFDTVRDLLLQQLANATVARHGSRVAALLLGRTARQLRNLRRLGAEPRGENYVERAEAVLRAEGPLTLAELAQRLPRYYAFDAARVALDALIANGRVVFTAPEKRRGGHGSYAVVAPPAPEAARADHGARTAAAEAHMRAVGNGLTGGPPPLTDRARLRPADVAQLMADAQAWLAARSDPSGAPARIYLGAVAE